MVGNAHPTKFALDSSRQVNDLPYEFSNSWSATENGQDTRLPFYPTD